MKLQFIKETQGIYDRVYHIGEVIQYRPWEFEWQGMKEQDRIAQGIFIHCFGMGEFERYDKGIDVEVI